MSVWFICATSYDQAFVEGRSIFANISRLVDELFNDYIVRRGQVQPMFSSYCNGTTATCKGLSQWGSYYLANQGYTPYRILQFYYGNNIDLVLNAPEGEIRESYPGRLLRRGSIGEELRTLQIMLRRVAQSFPAIPATEVNTGIFTGDTEAAVRAFQRVFGLTQDGVVGRVTWNRVVAIFNAVKRIAELDSEGISPEEARRMWSETLRMGDVGQEVQVIQYFLNFIGRFQPSIGQLETDGMFGPQTERAVREFQHIYGLTEDGVVGRATWNWIQSIYSDFYNGLSAEARQDFYPGYAYSSGNSGVNVRRIQFWLNALSSRIGGQYPLTVDGEFGPATERAIRAFQQYAQVPVSGSVGPLTWMALADMYQEMLAGP
ncbi:MAG: peptidoglycan-binding protein [Oscillospiraceae bacterium]|nr:peptidoglycan-binding protein [Oscillospiraceae bacterium]